MYENDLQYIEIVVDKYPSLISYHGKYFYRSGNTMRTITGKELDKAILNCSKSKATNIMNVMKSAKVIKKVTGLGPGKYEFVEV